MNVVWAVIFFVFIIVPGVLLRAAGVRFLLLRHDPKRPTYWQDSPPS